MTHVFSFDHPHELPPDALRTLLGGKGAALAEMTRVLRLPVPPGFTIATSARALVATSGLGPLRSSIDAALARLETTVGRRLGDPRRPLLVSVRSGAPVSMPGMLDTILDLGMNDETCEGLARETSRAFAEDCYARLVRMFGSIVLGVPAEAFADAAGAAASQRVRRWRAVVERESGEPVPDDAREQLERAIGAVFRSWDGPRALAYRERERIPAEPGTAVHVQAMVFGNRGSPSGTGVGFTRDPATGERVAYGDYLPGAQGEDVVAGTHAAQPLSALRDADPALHAELLAIFDHLERHARDACDVEFTVEEGVLWILQTRVAKRTAAAAVRMAVEMAEDPGFPLARDEALQRVEPEQLAQALASSRVSTSRAPLAKGLPASPGVAAGGACFSADEAVAAAERGEPVILVRSETSPEDVHGMAMAEGILTATGGLASHAAVVARGWGKPAVVGVAALSVGLGTATLAGVAIAPGCRLTLDGSSGEVFLDEAAATEAIPLQSAQTLLAWAAQTVGPGAEALEPVARLARAREILAARTRKP